MATGKVAENAANRSRRVRHQYLLKHRVRARRDECGYCASKSAVASFSKVAAIELAQDHIRLNTVFPGYVRIAILERSPQKG